MGRKRGQIKPEEMSNITPPQRRIEYVPPKSEDIRAFARLVCETLAAEKNDPTYLQYEIMYGLAQFLELVARVLAKRLNAEQLVDKDEK
ncbi:MAG: hypothetical protein K8L97_17385 [Anaerolineae bacterium]|nr:hypothetical protein [Anaerolineae bacterium]